MIENSGSKLLDDYHNLFKYRYNNNEESLLACQWYKSTTLQWYVCNATLSDLCADSKMLGGVMTLKQAWSVVDLAMALMTILNLIAVILLSRYAFRLLKDYKEQRRAGRDPMFHRSMFPDAKLDAWTEGTD